MEKWEKNTHSGHFSVTCTGTPLTCTGTVWVLVILGQPVPIQVRAVPVQAMLCFSISTGFRILAITCLFLIRVE